MRIFKLVGALFAVLAFTAFAVGTASAAETLWELLPGETGTTFTGKSGKATLQIKGGGSITCAGSTAEGEITSEKTLGLAFINFGSNCAVAGNSVKSIGDEAGHILVHVVTHDCLIEPGVLGLLLKVLPLQLEVTATGLLISVQGSLVGLVSPVGSKASTFTLLVQQKAGQQSIAKCEGSKAEDKLETSLDGGEFIQSGESANESTITFAAEQEAMA